MKEELKTPSAIVKKQPGFHPVMWVKKQLSRLTGSAKKDAITAMNEPLSYENTVGLFKKKFVADVMNDLQQLIDQAKLGQSSVTYSFRDLIFAKMKNIRNGKLEYAFAASDNFLPDIKRFWKQHGDSIPDIDHDRNSFLDKIEHEIQDELKIKIADKYQEYLAASKESKPNSWDLLLFNQFVKIYEFFGMPPLQDILMENGTSIHLHDKVA